MKRRLWILGALALGILACLLLIRGRSPQNQPGQAGDGASAKEEAAVGDGGQSSRGTASHRRRSVEDPASEVVDRVPLGISAAPAGGPARYAIRDGNVAAFFSPKGVALALMAESHARVPGEPVSGWGVHWGIAGAQEVEPRAEGELPGLVNVLKGSPDQWKTDQKTYSKMVYSGVKPGVDLIVESRPHGIEYSLQVERAAQAAALRFRYEGARIEVVEDGLALEIRAGDATLREDGLRCTQQGRPLQARYVALGADEYALAIEGADPGLPLDIDPTIGWSTFLGGTRSQTGGTYDEARGIAVDSSGNVYVCGNTNSADFPSTGGFQTKWAGGYDAFVTKINAAGSTIAWSSFLGGMSDESAYGIAVDTGGNVYLTGYTNSSDFPTTTGAYDTTYGESTDAFVTKINAAGSSIAWSTFLGGSGYETARSIALDSSGNAYVGGLTGSYDFPIVGGFQSSLRGYDDGFVAKVKSDGSNLSWSSYLGGWNYDSVNALAVDGSGNTYVGGSTASNDFTTTTGAYSRTYWGNYDVFVTRISATGSMLWSTYIGGAADDQCRGLAIDASGNVFITGYTYNYYSPSYPTTAGAYRQSINGYQDIFVTNLKSNGTGLNWSTFLGGYYEEYQELGNSIKVDASGSAYVTGYTSSYDFPTTSGAYQGYLKAGYDAFVTRFYPDGSWVYYSTYLGGYSSDYPTGLAINSSGNAYVCGYTYSTDFPTPGGFDTSAGGNNEAFISKINQNGTNLVWSSYLGGQYGPGNDQGRDVAVDGSGNVYVAGTTQSIDFPTSAGAIRQTYGGYGDVFLTKYDSTGTSALWSTYLGGGDGDYLGGMAVDGSGQVYVAGYTYSWDYPVLAGYQMSRPGWSSGYVTKLNSTGGLVWSSFLGGTNQDFINAIAVDASGNAYVAGESWSWDFPVSPWAYQTWNNYHDVFVARFNTSGDSLAWSTYLGGWSDDYVRRIQVDASGNAIVAGTTWSSNFPITPGAYQTSLKDWSQDAFVAKLSVAGESMTLAFSTYLGGSSSWESPEGLAIDGDGNVYVTGGTQSSNFPVTAGAYRTSFSGISEGYVSKFDSTGSTLVWSTFLGGSQDDYPMAIKVDSVGSVFVAGVTFSSDFPTKNAFNSTYRGGDAFVTRLSSAGTALGWSSFLGGSKEDYAFGLALKSDGTLYVTGYTNSWDFPTVNPVDPNLDGWNAFVSRIDNSNPNDPSQARQYRQDGVTELSTGGWTNESNIVVKTTVSDVDGDPVRLRVEIKRTTQGFDGSTNVYNGDWVMSGATASVTVQLPVVGPEYHWRCQVVDSNGRTSTWKYFGNNPEGDRDVGKDTQGPTVTIQLPTTGLSYTTASSPISLSGISSDDKSGVASVTWTRQGGMSGGASGTTSWSILSLALASGSNVITVTATDGAGNQGLATLNVTYDTSPPTVSFTSPVSLLTGASSLSAGGNATDNFEVASVTWSNSRGGSGTATLTGGATNRDWSATIPLSPGSNTITVIATDGAGSTALSSRTFTYDNVAPSVQITSPAGSTYTTANSTITVMGTSSDANGFGSVTWSNAATGGTGTASGTSSWTASNIALNAGANAITVKATDAVGNYSTTSITVHRDTANPAVAITIPTGTGSYVTGSSTVALGGTATDDIYVFNVTWVNDRGGSGTATLSGSGSSRTWSVASVGLLTDLNVITVTATDSVGRTGTAIINVTYDATAPALVVSTPSEATYVTAATPILVSGTASAAGVKTINSITVQNMTTGAWSTVTPTPALPAQNPDWSASVALVIGTNTVVVTAQDSATVTTNITLTITLDPYTPAVTITGPSGSGSYVTATTPLVLSGVASDNRGITQVSWSNTTTSQSGTATLSGPPASVTWNVSSIPLAIGANQIAVTARDEAGNTATVDLEATYDTAAPGIAITEPTAAPTFTTTSASIGIGGSANDSVSIARVTWANAATGGSGTASGTTGWSVSAVPLNPGANPITTIAFDDAGNTRSATITIYCDTGVPTVGITSPTSLATYSTGTATLALGGISSDDVNVVAVTWQSVGLTTRFGVAAGTTTWSVASIPLDPGDNVITVTVTDGASQSATSTLTVNYDPTPPSVAITTPGTSPFNTTITPVSLEGTSSDNEGVVGVTWSNTGTGGSGAASGMAAWSALCPLTSGTNTISVTTTDAAGNTATASITVVYDTSAPVVSITAPTTGISFTTGLSPVTISGTAEDDVEIASITWASDRAVIPPSGTAAGTESWSFSVALATGSNVITVTATDEVGRTGTSRLTVIYDDVPPHVNITAPTGDSMYSTRFSALNLGGNASDNLDLRSIAWSNAATGSSGTAAGTAAWTASSIALVEGSNAITVTATDGVGNTATTALTVIYDATAPAVAITTPTDQPTYSTSTRPLAIGGTATDNLQVVSVSWASDRGGSGAASISGPVDSRTWSASVYLYPGTNTITLTAVDGLANSTTAQLAIDFSLETEAPATAITGPSSSGFANSSATVILIGGTADDNVGVVSVVWENLTTRVKGTATVTGSGTVTWSADVPLTAGTNTIVVTSTDDAGNTGTGTIDIYYNPPPESTPPQVQITSPTTLTTSTSPQPMTISATDNVGVSSVSWFNAAIGGDGVASPAVGSEWTASVPLAPGINEITVTAKDPAGNVATAWIALTFSAAPGDTSPPSVAITSHPTGSTLVVDSQIIDLGGTASDNVAVAASVWSNDASGQGGTTDGLSSWSTAVPLTPGLNVITVTAYDTSGNRSTDKIYVDYVPPPPPPVHIKAGSVSCGSVGLDLLLPLGLLLLGRRALCRRRKPTSCLNR